MNALLRAELLKLSTTRTFAGLAGAAVAVSVLITALVALLTEPSREDVLVDVFTSDVSTLFVMILAVIGLTGEWRHRTIAGALLAAPDRVRLLAAKLAAFAVCGLALSLLISAAVTVVGITVLAARDLPLPGAGELAAQLARNGLVAALSGALGVGIGALLRNQAVALVTLILLVTVVDTVVLSLAPEVGRFSPFGGLPVAAADIPPEAVDIEGVELPSPPVAVLLMGAWIAALFASGAVLLRARDV